MGESFRGKTVELIGDNQGAISALASHRSIDSVLAAVARAIWFHIAKYQVRLVCTHRPGSQMELADSLSRVYVSEHAAQVANALTRDAGLMPVKVYPAMHNYSKYF